MSIGKEGKKDRAARVTYRLLLSCGLRGGDQGWRRWQKEHCSQMRRASILNGALSLARDQQRRIRTGRASHQWHSIKMNLEE